MAATHGSRLPGRSSAPGADVSEPSGSRREVSCREGGTAETDQRVEHGESLEVDRTNERDREATQQGYRFVRDRARKAMIACGCSGKQNRIVAFAQERPLTRSSPPDKMNIQGKDSAFADAEY